MPRSIRMRASSAFSRLMSICSTLTGLTVPTLDDRPARGQQDWRDLFWDGEHIGRVPSRAVHNQDGLGARRDVAGYLIKMQLHRIRVGPRRSDGGAFAMRWTERAELIGVLVALVSRLSRSGPGFRPLSNDAVLLADPSLVFEPDFDRRRLGHASQMRVQRILDVCFNTSTISPFCLGSRGLTLMWENSSLFRIVPL